MERRVAPLDGSVRLGRPDTLAGPRRCCLTAGPASARSDSVANPASNPRPPVIVDSWDGLDTGIAKFINEKGRSAGTQRADAFSWLWWVRHLESLSEGLPEPLDPWDAPWAAWAAIGTARKGDGSRYALKHPGRVLNAVSLRYARAGRPPPPPKRPEYAGEWAQLVKAHGREPRKHTARGVPMLEPDIAAILAAPIENMPGTAQRPGRREYRVAVLAALETQLTATALHRVSMAEVVPGEDGAVVAGVKVPCDHRERARGVPWDCAACAILDHRSRRLADGAEATARFLEPLTLTTLDKGFRRMRASWPPLLREGASLRLAAGSSDYEVAGTRRGLVLAVLQPRENGWLVGRAWAGLAWSCGFRMCGDLASLPRAAVSSATNGDGLVVRLGLTKDDITGEAKDVARTFLFDGVAAPATQALAEYLAVRDAALGSDGPLICVAKGGWPGGSVSQELDSGDASRFLQRLATTAGIDKYFSSYSTRRGYSAQADIHGWDPERVQQGLRHVSPDTRQRHYRASAPKTAAKKLSRAIHVEAGEQEAS